MMDDTWYVIGDVHGEYKTLVELVSELPSDAKLCFVGDLIDRGPDSKKVVEFVRNGGHKCVLGNHEAMMIEEAYRMKQLDYDYIIDDLWHINGGLETLESYGISEYLHTDGMERFIDDAEWMESLPLVENIMGFNISHAHVDASIAEVAVCIKPGDKGYEELKSFVTWSRKMPKDKNNMNIFGHTPHKKWGKETRLTLSEQELRSGVNIDTGCAYNGDGKGYLSAVCLNDGSVIRKKRVD